MTFEQFEHFERAQMVRENRFAAQRGEPASGSWLDVHNARVHLPIAARPPMTIGVRTSHPTGIAQHREGFSPALGVARPCVKRRCWYSCRSLSGFKRASDGAALAIASK